MSLSELKKQQQDVYNAAEEEKNKKYARGLEDQEYFAAMDKEISKMLVEKNAELDDINLTNAGVTNANREDAEEVVVGNIIYS